MSAFQPHLTRIEWLEDKEQDGYLVANVRGRAGQAPRDMLSVQQHGFASRPPTGAVGSALTLGGEHGQTLLLGGEHPGHRPPLGVGETAIYNAHGAVISVVKNEVRFVHPTKVHIVAPEIILEGTVRLGGPNASLEASMRNSIDTAGLAMVGALSTKVFIE